MTTMRAENHVRRLGIAAVTLLFLYVASIGPWIALMNRDTPTNEKVQVLEPIYYPLDIVCNRLPPLELVRRVYCKVWMKIIPSKDVSE